MILSPSGEAVNIADGDRCEIDAYFSRQRPWRADLSLRVNAHARYPSIDSIRHDACLDDMDARRNLQNDSLTVVTSHQHIQQL